MEQSEVTLLKGLVKIMWADGEIAEAEREMLGSILVQLGCNHQEIAEIATMMKEPPDLDEIVKCVPDEASRLDVLKVVSAMALADRKMAAGECQLLDKLAAKLGVSDSQLQQVKEETAKLMAANRAE